MEARYRNIHKYLRGEMLESLNIEFYDFQGVMLRASVAILGFRRENDRDLRSV